MQLDPEYGSIRPLLEQLGRASTPAVNTTAYNVNVCQLAGYDLPEADDNGDVRDPVLIVVTSALEQRIRQNYPVLVAAPGLTEQQRSTVTCPAAVIEGAALHRGPWAGAALPARDDYLFELFELLRDYRRRALQSYYLPDPSLPTPVQEALQQAAGIVIVDGFTEPATEGSLGTVLQQTLANYVSVEASA